MKVKLTDGTILDTEDGYAARMIEQGQAVPYTAPKAEKKKGKSFEPKAKDSEEK